jgi:hypothetical protein
MAANQPPHGQYDDGYGQPAYGDSYYQDDGQYYDQGEYPQHGGADGYYDQA